MVNQVVLIGTESSGKTTLANLLTVKYKAILVEEYAREYLQKLNRPYNFDDVILMAKQQLELEKKAIENHPKLVLYDTDLSVFSIWIKEKYDQQIDWIEACLAKATHKIYLLCDIDVPWEADNLREHPIEADRIRLFNNYKKLLEKHQLTYHIISGDIATRLKKCSEIYPLGIV